MEHEVLFRDIAAAELKVRCNLEVEALGELFIQCSCVIGIYSVCSSNVAVLLELYSLFRHIRVSAPHATYNRSYFLLQKKYTFQLLVAGLLSAL